MNILPKYFENELKPKLEKLKENIQYTKNRKNSPYIYATTRKYKYHTEVWIPDTPINLDNLTHPDVIAKRSRARGTSMNRDISIENSVRRTRQTIFGYAAMNPFQYFATFTHNCSRCIWKCSQKPCSIAGPHSKKQCNTVSCDCPSMFCDRFNLELVDKRVTNWLKNQKKRGSPDMEYLLVYEKHKCGDCKRRKAKSCNHDVPRAYHAHALILGYDGTMDSATDHFTLKPTMHDKRPVFNMPGWPFGYSTAKIIGQTKDDNIRTSGYLTKYITKDTITDLNKHRYRVSRGLLKPSSDRNPEYINPDALIAVDTAYDGKYGTKIQFDNGKL